MLGAHFSDAVASPVLNSLLESWREVDELRMNASIRHTALLRTIFPTYSPTPDSPEAEYPAAFVQDYHPLQVSDLEAAGFTVLDGRVVPPEPPPASPIHDAPPAAQPSLPGSSQAGPSTLPFGKPTHECQEEMFGVHFSDAVASRVFITLLEMGHEVDQERVHTFVCGQLCAEPKPLKGIIFYVNKYVGEVVDGALEGLDGVVVYGRDHDSDSR